MPYPLNNVTTADDYTAANTLDNQAPCVLVTIHVFNAAIYYKLQIGRQPMAREQPFRQEVFLAPGFHTLARTATGIAVRSAKAGVPAQVTAALIPADEIPE